MIKLLSTLLLLMVPSASFAKDHADCWYYTKGHGDEKYTRHCLNFNKEKAKAEIFGDAQIAKEVALELEYDADGLSYVRTQVGFLYINSKGYLRKAITYDNGPDLFAEGFARTRQGSQIGYFDKTLKIKIPAIYDFGSPFTNGVAIVCIGCVEKSDGEHNILLGGLWGAIDPNGAIVYEIKYAENEIRKLVEN